MRAADGEPEPVPRGAAGRPRQLSRHALRTPLLAIRGTAELLLAGAGGPLGQGARELLAASGEAALRLEGLIEPLLRVAERAGCPAGALAPVDPGALLRAAGIEPRAAAPAAGRARAGPPPVTPRVRGRAACLGEALELVGRLLGAPLAAELRRSSRSGALLVLLEGRGAAGCSEDEQPLLLGLAGRLARLGGARLVVAPPGRLGLVLRPLGTRPLRPGEVGAAPPGRAAARRRCGTAVTP